MYDDAGLSDATDSNGVVFNVISENIDSDIFTIGIPTRCIFNLTWLQVTMSYMSQISLTSTLWR